MTYYTRTLILILSVCLLGGAAAGQMRRNVVVLPFSTGADQMWLSMATARVLSAKMERTGRLRRDRSVHNHRLAAHPG